MTGEVTLQGRVLPIGGLKQKVLAAHAAGLTDVVIPERNRADLEDVPEEVREEMTLPPGDEHRRGARARARAGRGGARGVAPGPSRRARSNGQRGLTRGIDCGSVNGGAKAVVVVAGAIAALTALAPAAQADPVVAGEFAMPGASELGPDNEIVMAPDGNMWTTTDVVNGVARFTQDGTATFFPTAATTYGITVGPDGNLWASQEVGVAKIDPATGTATETAIVGGCAGCRGITTGPDGKIWIVGTNKLVRIDPANPAVGQDSNVIATTNPKGMTTGSDGLLWFADGPNVVSATAADTPVLTAYPIGNSTGGAQDVAAGPNGQVAYGNPVDNPQGVGLISPGGAPLKVSLENSDPFGVTFANDGAYWVARSATNDLLRLTTTGETSTLGGFAPSGGVGPRKITTGPNDTLWVTLDTPNKVAKVTGVTPPPEPTPTPTPTPTPIAPETTITKAPDKKIEAKKSSGKAKVKFKFSATGTAPSFECALYKKGKQPNFKPCSSPAKYKLKPHKYRFQVRATADGLADQTPAVAKFKVVER